MIFCQDCASKPGWPFNALEAVNHRCNRCFQYRPCFDFTAMKGKRAKVAAQVGRDMKNETGINPSYDCKLPQATLPAKPPVPVTVIEDERTEIDKILDATQPNRPGIKLHTIQKGGGKTAK